MMPSPDAPESESHPKDEPSSEQPKRRIYICDRCGFKMIEKNCKVVCPNCGSRYDCSDLNIYFD
jgi:rubrerythrin